MPRYRRALAGGNCYHLLNRGNRKAAVFHDTRDYGGFVDLIVQACARTPIRLIAFCLMPNHFHFVVWPRQDGDASRWMQWIMTTHVRRYHRRYGTEGRVWQGRFKGFPIQDDAHLVTVLRYVERNPLRANLVSSAEDWKWSSLWHVIRGDPFQLLNPGPVPRWSEWCRYVNGPQSAEEIEAIRTCVRRQRPYGDEGWASTKAVQLGLEFTLRNKGRPPKSASPKKS